jgi:hypothetical protein
MWAVFDGFGVRLNFSLRPDLHLDSNDAFTFEKRMSHDRRLLLLHCGAGQIAAPIVLLAKGAMMLATD